MLNVSAGLCVGVCCVVLVCVCVSAVCGCHGRRAVDFERKAVVVEYEIEAAVMDDFGEELRVERKHHRKLYVLSPPQVVVGCRCR